MKKIFIFVVLILSLITINTNAGVKEVYQKHCIACHGVDGKGQTKLGVKLEIKDHSRIEVKDEVAFKSIKDGLKKGDRTFMKAYGNVLTDEEIKELVKYMKEFKK